MFRLLLIVSVIFTISCGSSSEANSSSEASKTLNEEALVKKNLPVFDSNFERIDFPEVDVDPGNDSLWYHLVLDIPGDKWLAVAQPTNENNRRGIRMQLMSMNVDSTFSVHTESSPGYDSAKLFPTFFKDAQGRLIILADTGERQSWGQKVYLLNNERFEDLGFLDVGTVAYTEEDGQQILAPTTIAERVTIEQTKKGLEFRFSGKDLVLFDDGKGNLDTIIDASSICYRLNKRGKFTLKKSRS